jgi:hypothetical protein
MAERTISALSIPNRWQAGGDTLELRIYAAENFYALNDSLDTVLVQMGRIGDAGAPATVATCTINGDDIVIPAIDLFTTTDSPTNENVKYAAVFFFNEDGVKLNPPLLSDFSVPHNYTDPMTWAQLENYNRARKARRDDTQWNRTQTAFAISEAINAVVTNPASTSQRGNIKTDTAPDDPTSPYAVGINSPRVSKVLSADYGNSLATAISDIGSTDTKLIVKTNTSFSTAIVVPDNILLVPENGALINVTGAGSLEFEGKGIADPLSLDPIFSGFAAGKLLWSGDVYPTEVSSAIMANTNLNDKMNVLTAAFENKSVTFIQHPAPTTDSVTLNDGHSIFRMPGDYANSINTNSDLEPPYVLGSDASFCSADGAISYDSSVDNNTYMIYFKVGAKNSYVEGNHFVSGGGAHGGVNATVLIRNNENCHIRNNFFDGCLAYHAEIAIGDIDEPNNRNCSITGNLFKGYLSQLATIASGVGCSISDNVFDLEDVSGASGGVVVIDIEPNNTQNYIEDLLVENNRINIRGVNRATTGIGIQGVNTANIKHATVRFNQIIGGENYTESQLTTGIGISGVYDLKLYSNEVTAANDVAYKITNCRNVTARNNDAYKGASQTGNLAAMQLLAVADAKIITNIFNRETAPTYATKIYEGEQEKTAISSGSVISATNTTGRFYQFWEDLVVTYNATDYTVTAVDNESPTQTITVTPSVGSVTAKTFTTANVTTGTDSIAISSHGFNTGARVRLSSSGTVPAHTAPPADAVSGLVTYFWIATDANNGKLASSYANSLAGTAIDLTSGGSGTHTLTPVLITKFSNNKYKDNDADGITLEATGTSAVLSEFGDAFAEKQDAAGKDASGGYVGKTLEKINFYNAARTFISFFVNTNSAARTYTFQDRNGTIADDTDLALKANAASPTLTGTPLAPTAATGTNTTQIATTAFVQGEKGWTISSVTGAQSPTAAQSGTLFDFTATGSLTLPTTGLVAGETHFGVFCDTNDNVDVNGTTIYYTETTSPIAATTLRATNQGVFADFLYIKAGTWLAIASGQWLDAS